jgi:hypothetical protein
MKQKIKELRNFDPDKKFRTSNSKLKKTNKSGNA